MKMKKLTSLGLASALALSVAAPAMAAANTNLNQSTSFTGGNTEVPAIDVTAASPVGVVLNPYSMKVSVTGGNALASGSLFTNDQLVNSDVKITNASNVPLRVDAKVTAKKSGNVVFATEDWDDESEPTTNSVFAWLEVQLIDDNGDVSFDDSYDEENEYQALLGASAVTKTGMAEIPAYVGEARYKINGKAASAPTKPWAQTDKFDTTIAWTFTPITGTDELSDEMTYTLNPTKTSVSLGNTTTRKILSADIAEGEVKIKLVSDVDLKTNDKIEMTFVAPNGGALVDAASGTDYAAGATNKAELKLTFTATVTGSTVTWTMTGLTTGLQSFTSKKVETFYAKDAFSVEYVNVNAAEED